jgi:anti-sigma regulatory factor (Ser/Thr protein kinase)
MERIVLSAKLENLESMIRFIRNGAETYGFDSKKINHILVAAEEPLMNVISYAYPDKNGNIEITYDIEEGKGFVIEVIDWGIPFDPLSLPEPDVHAPIEDREIGGLGIYMMRKIMDEVRYRREDDRNILTLMAY